MKIVLTCKVLVSLFITFNLVASQQQKEVCILLPADPSTNPFLYYNEKENDCYQFAQLAFLYAASPAELKRKYTQQEPFLFYEIIDEGTKYQFFGLQNGLDQEKPEAAVLRQDRFKNNMTDPEYAGQAQILTSKLLYKKPTGSRYMHIHYLYAHFGIFWRIHDDASFEKYKNLPLDGIGGKLDFFGQILKITQKQYSKKIKLRLNTIQKSKVGEVLRAFGFENVVGFQIGKSSIRNHSQAVRINKRGVICLLILIPCLGLCAYHCKTLWALLAQSLA